MDMDSFTSCCIFALFDTKEYQHPFVTQECVTSAVQRLCSLVSSKTQSSSPLKALLYKGLGNTEISWATCQHSGFGILSFQNIQQLSEYTLLRLVLIRKLKKNYAGQSMHEECFSCVLKLEFFHRQNAKLC